MKEKNKKWSVKELRRDKKGWLFIVETIREAEKVEDLQPFLHESGNYTIEEVKDD